MPSHERKSEIYADEDGPIEVFVEVDAADAEVLALGKQRKYERLAALNTLAAAAMLCVIAAAAAVGLAAGNANWYVAEVGEAPARHSWGAVLECPGSSVCRRRPLAARNTTESCRRSDSEMQLRFGAVLGLVGAHVLCVAFAAVLTLGVALRPTRSPQAVAAGTLLLLGACCGAACVMLFTLTLGDWYHCGSTFCGTTSVSPCTEGIGYAGYVMIAAVALSFAAATLLFVLRAAHYGARCAALAEVLADREMAELRRIKAERRRARREREAQQRQRLLAEEAERNRATIAASGVAEAQLVSEAAAEEPVSVAAEEEEQEEEEEEELEPAGFHIDGATDWVFDQRSRFYYSHDTNLFWDPSTRRYFDVNHSVWRATPF